MLVYYRYYFEPVSCLFSDIYRIKIKVPQKKNMAAMWDSQLKDRVVKTLVSTHSIPQETAEYPDDSGRFDEFDHIVSTYILSFIWIPGLIVNILAVIVFSMTGLKNSPTSFFFRALAIFDMLAVMEAIESLLEFHITIDGNAMTNVWGCRIFEWFFSTVKSICSWILVGISLERSIGLRYPHKVSVWFSRRNEVIYLLCMSVVMVGFYAVIFFIIEQGEEQCLISEKPHLQVHIDILAWGFLCFYCLVPFVVIAVSNISIILLLVKLKRQEDQQDLMTNTIPDPNIRTMTTMLLVVSFTSILLTAPVACFYIWALLYENEGGTDLGNLLWPLGLLCVNLNHSLNFFLYCMISGTFRANLKQLFCGKKQELDIDMTSMNVMENAVSEDL